MLYQEINSIGQYTFECIRYSNFNFIPHLHKHLELLYVRDGEVVIDSDGLSESLPAGKFALILSNRVHAYSSPNGSLVDVCVFSEDNIPTFGKAVHNKRAEALVFSCSDAVAKFAESVLFSGHPTESVYLRKAALYAIVSEYLEQVSFTADTGGDNNLFTRILSYISAHYRENITLQSTAKALGYEPHYLSGYFHRNVKINFSEFVNRYRIDAAKDMLKDSSLPITEVALRSGFQSIRSFNRIFQSITGETPTQRRARYSKDTKKQ